MSMPSDPLNDALRQALKRPVVNKQYDSALESRVINSIRTYQTQRRRTRMALSLCTCIVLVACITWVFMVYSSGVQVKLIDGPGLISLNSKPVNLTSDIKTLSARAELNTKENQLLVQLNDNEQIILDINTEITLLNDHTVSVQQGHLRYRNHSINHKTVFLINGGSIRPVGTEFDLSIDPQLIRLAMIDGTVMVKFKQNSNTATLGQLVTIDHHSINVAPLKSPIPTWWKFDEPRLWTEYIEQ